MKAERAYSPFGCAPIAFVKHQVRHTIFHCHFPGAIVVLDIVPDRYLLLKGDGAQRFAEIAGRTPNADDLRWLAERDLGTAICPSTAEALKDHIPPSASAVDDGLAEAGVWDTLQALVLQLRYKRRLKRVPLISVIENLIGRRKAISKQDLEAALKIAAAFDRSKRYIRSQEQCLPRALAMAHMLFRQGVSVQVIFGVTLPFSAHCWVQVGSTILTDSADKVRPFQPIMVLP